jgi:CheY-like chemotaxis protein
VGDVAQVVETTGPAERARALAATEIRPLKVLVAEDNDTNRMLFQSMLSRLGHTVDTAVNGKLALAAVEARDFDIILMDMQMPEMDGLEATRRIRAKAGTWARPPIIALTADALSDHHAEFRAAGVDEVVVKPVDWPALLAAMNRLTAGAAPSDDAPPPPAVGERATPGNDPFAAQPILDTTIIDSLASALPADTIAGLLAKFTANAGMYASDIIVAVAQSDLDKVKRAAHALKGLSSQFGAARLTAIVKVFDAADTPWRELQDLVPLLQSTLRETQSAVSAMRRR